MTTITPNPNDRNQSFRAVAQPFLQANGLPFADVLTAESIEKAFRDRDALFGQSHLYSTRSYCGAFSPRLCKTARAPRAPRPSRTSPRT